MPVWFLLRRWVVRACPVHAACILPVGLCRGHVHECGAWGCGGGRSVVAVGLACAAARFAHPCTCGSVHHHHRVCGRRRVSRVCGRRPQRMPFVRACIAGHGRPACCHASTERVMGVAVRAWHVRHACGRRSCLLWGRASIIWVRAVCGRQLQQRWCHERLRVVRRVVAGADWLSGDAGGRQCERHLGVRRRLLWHTWRCALQLHRRARLGRGTLDRLHSVWAW